jgi:hypothetical protein
MVRESARDIEDDLQFMGWLLGTEHGSLSEWTDQQCLPV